MKQNVTQRGVTLIELLVTIAVLSMVLAGIYGLLDSGHDIYLETLALSESQQTARVVMNYLTFRLREVDGGGSGSLGPDPRRCTDCHIYELDKNPSVNDPEIVCELDVLIPRPSLFFENITAVNGIPSFIGRSVASLTGVAANYTTVNGGNYVEFWADLLPIQGMSDTFADGANNRNDSWDLTVEHPGGIAGVYDPGKDEREILFLDHNDNGRFDYYGEKWAYGLQKPAERNYYELVEYLSFENYTTHARTVYSYDSQGKAYNGAPVPVAYGITGLGIAVVPKFNGQADFQTKMNANGVRPRQMGSYRSCVDGCHAGFGSTYEDASTPGNFDFNYFVAKHRWWNVKGFSVEIVAADPQGRKFSRMKQFIIPRNLEVNQR